MLTVTAPGDRQHYLRDGSACPCTPEGGVNVAEFNATAGKRFNHLITALRRWYGDAQYGRAAECQDGKRGGCARGALHFHVLLWVERPDHLRRDFRAGDPFCRLRELVERCGFGHSIDLKLATPGDASYCAKYVSKTADDRAVMPWLDRTTGEISTGNGRYRPWSASRRWGLTMKQVRQAQADWVRSQADARATSGEPEAAAGALAAEGGPLDHNTVSYTPSTTRLGALRHSESLD